MSTFIPLSTEPEPEDIHAEFLRQKAYRLAKERLEAEEETAVDLDGLYLDRGQLDQLTIPPAFITGVVPRSSYGILRGRDGTYKSFVALDWALHLATGRMYNLTPVEQTRVLYIAGEGVHGLPPRIAAWDEAHQTKVDPAWFTVRREALNLHRPGPAFDHLLEHVGERRYGLSVIDTLRRVAGGADGNSSEMGAVVDNITQIRRASEDSTVLVIAHTDKETATLGVTPGSRMTATSSGMPSARATGWSWNSPR